MCKSQAEGGQRCAAHTRKKFLATPATDPAYDDVAAEYASTPEGHRTLTDAAIEASLDGDFATEARLKAIIDRGESIRAANREAATLIGRDAETSANLDTLIHDTARHMRKNPERLAATFRKWQRNDNYDDIESPDPAFRPDPSLYADDPDTARALRKLGFESYLAQRLPVFVYGTLRRGQGNDRLMNGAIAERSEEAHVTGIAIYGPDRGFPYAQEAPDGEGITRGDLVYLTDDTEGDWSREALDGLEGFNSDLFDNSHYRRVETTVTYTDPSTGQTRQAKAWTYLAGDYARQSLTERERIYDGDWVKARAEHRGTWSTRPSTSYVRVDETTTDSYAGDYVVKKSSTESSAAASAAVFSHAGYFGTDEEFEEASEFAGIQSLS